MTGTKLWWTRGPGRSPLLYAVALVVDDQGRPQGHQRGLVWLVGDDVPNACEPTAREQQVLTGMHARREEYRDEHRATRDST